MLKQVVAPVECTFAAYLTDESGQGHGCVAGDILYIDANADRLESDVIAVHRDGTVSMGRVLGATFIPGNPALPPEQLDRFDDILGKVVGHFRSI